MNQESLNNFLKSELSLDRIELLIVEVPQKTIFRSAIGERKARLALIIKWCDSNGTVGYGECSCRPDPFYSHEFVNGATNVIKQFLFPLIRDVESYGDLLLAMHRVRGWNFTKAAIEFAANDVIRNSTGKGILEISGITPIDKVPVGISLGLFDNTEKLLSKLDELKDSGYQRLKFKITKGYNDAELLKAFAEIDHPNVAFDANGAFDASGFDDLSSFAELNRIIEQPYPPSALYLHQEYIENHKDFMICLDEEVESYGNLVSNTLHMRQLNIKPGRVGGLWNTLKMIEYCNKHGIDTWIGGMFETSIGRALNLQVASLLPEAKAHDLSPSSRYFERDLVTRPIAMNNGFIARSEYENISIDEDAIADLLVEKITLKK